MDKSFYNNLSILQKIQLYFIVPMLFWLLLFLLENFNKKDDQIKGIDTKATIIDIDSQKLEKLDSSRAIQFLEEKIKKYKLSTQSIQHKEKKIIISTSGTTLDILSFLQKIKLHLHILSFRISQQDGKTDLDLTVKIEHFFNKGALQKEFYKERKKEIQNNSTMIQPTLEAVVGNEVLIEGVWYKKGDSYHQYKIDDIQNRYIKLQNKKTKHIVKIEVINESL